MWIPMDIAIIYIYIFFITYYYHIYRSKKKSGGKLWNSPSCTLRNEPLIFVRLPFSYRFWIKRPFVGFKVNRKMVIPFWFWFNWTRFRKYFSMCIRATCRTVEPLAAQLSHLVPVPPNAQMNYTKWLKFLPNTVQLTDFFSSIYGIYNVTFYRIIFQKEYFFFKTYFFIFQNHYSNSHNKLDFHL